MMTFNEALTILKVDEQARAAVEDAQRFLVEELVRYRAALQFYAKQENYLDGAPMLSDFAVNDDGFTARKALRLDDYRGDVLVAAPEEGNSNEDSSERGEAA